jgi:hypothetical protein
MRGNYDPHLLPGHTGPDQPQINRPGSQTGSRGIAPIESRYYALVNDPRVIGLDSNVRVFLQTDVPHLLRIADAVKRMARATNTADWQQACQDAVAVFSRL